MSQLKEPQKEQLLTLMGEVKRLQKELQTLHRKTGYEDFEHGVLALQIAQHAVEETLEHTGLRGEIQRKPNPTAHRKAREWQKIVKACESRAEGFSKPIPMMI